MPRFLQVVKRKLATFATLLEHGQCFEAARRMCDQCLPPRIALLGKSHLMLWECNGAPLTRPTTALRFREASETDLGALLETSGDSGSPTAERVFRGFFAAGCRCYLLRVSDQIVGYCWLFFGQYIITHDSYQTSRVIFALNGDSVFIGNVFIRPECRRRGFYSSLLSGVLQEAKSSYGTSRFFVEVKAGNSPSLRAHAQSGFTIVATLYYVGLLGARFLVMVPTSGRPRVHRVTNNSVMKL